MIYLVALASVFVILSGIRGSAYIINPILLAAIITITVLPVPSRLTRRGVPGWLALVQTYCYDLDGHLAVEKLAGMVHMGRTSFYESFRDVMHLSPLQYAKSVKLDRARTFPKTGKNVNETSYLVGYNSPTQFSREYKRHFGFAPSAT